MTGDQYWLQCWRAVGRGENWSGHALCSREGGPLLGVVKPDIQNADN